MYECVYVHVYLYVCFEEIVGVGGRVYAIS